MSSERVVFWYGCNVVRHGDIIHYAIDLLRAAGIEPEPAGGPGYCCGTMKDANLQAAEGMAKRTVGKFNAFETDKVVTWCPSCHRHMNQFMGEYTEANFTVSHFVQILHRNRERLARAFVHPVSQRVLLHRHVGFHEVADLNELICDLLRLVPGLTLIESEHLAPGHMCSALVPVPAALKDVTRRLCDDARAHQVDTVATVFHSCQRMMCGLEAHEPFRVVNYVALLGAALGRVYPDEYKSWKTAATEEEIRARVGPERIEKMGEPLFENALLPELLRRPQK
ncbi:MAG TPA: (Fe-S)-binding protein [Burkholderiales bacterium]|nr:(Fe-S)-binding protein [Burkholderiales bacterium]